MQTDGAAGLGGVQEESTEGSNRRLANTLSDQDRDSENRTKVFGSLKLGDMLRVHVPDRGQLIGRLEAKSDTSITLTGKTRGGDISIMMIDALWVRTDARGTGTIVGGVVGLLVGIGVGSNAISVCKKNTGYSIEGDCNMAKYVSGLAFALGGAILGASIGEAVVSWHLTYSLPSYRQRLLEWQHRANSSRLTDGSAQLRLAVSFSL